MMNETKKPSWNEYQDISNTLIQLLSKGYTKPMIKTVLEQIRLEQQPNQCNNCIHLEEQNGSNCYECIKGIADNFEAQSCEKDCVSRTNVKEQMLKYGFHAPDMTVTEFVEDCLPPVTPERPKGGWIKVDDEEPIAYDCSECNTMVSKKYNYCPECGAYMRGEEDANCN